MSRNEFVYEQDDGSDTKFIPVEDLESKMQMSLLSSIKFELKGQIKILLAEDSDSDYFFLSDALEKSVLNYKLDWVRNGLEVLEWLNEHFDKGEVPDLLLLDINMPKLNGHEVLKKLRADIRFKNLLTIVLTGSKSPIDIEVAYENGANSFIVKNSDFDKLVEALDALKIFWFDTAEGPARI